MCVNSQQAEEKKHHKLQSHVQTRKPFSNGKHQALEQRMFFQITSKKKYVNNLKIAEELFEKFCDGRILRKDVIG